MKITDNDTRKFALGALNKKNDFRREREKLSEKKFSSASNVA
jgi:hypothetical protein